MKDGGPVFVTTKRQGSSLFDEGASNLPIFRIHAGAQQLARFARPNLAVGKPTQQRGA
jgi:hypothetical protein